MFKLIAGGLWLVIIITYFIIKSRLGLSTQELGINVLNGIQWSAYAALIFIGIYVLRWLTLFPAGVMTLMWWVIFGPIWWVIYTFIASIASAVFGHQIGYVLWHTSTPTTTWIIATIKSKMQWDWLLSVVLIRLVPMNYDLVNYSLWILWVKFWPHLIGTALGILPAMVSIVLVWASLQWVTSLKLSELSINPLYIGIAIWLYLISFGITYLVRRTYKI
jgi:uncharacterized membrane protein YdjX (TVP38/TMEM64 family)